MYLQYWRLKEKPFENTPDPKYLFHSPQHEEALSRLVYVVREGKGAGLLTGTYGCGKTLLAHALFRELEQDVYRVAFVTNPRLNDLEILRMITHHLGTPQVPANKADVLFQLEEILHSNMRDGRKTVVVIDEAHAVESNDVFEELRLLLNFQHDSRFLLTLLLIGQPELLPKINALKQFSQRIAMRFNLDKFNFDETANYVNHRLLIAGAKAALFSEEALQILYDHSGGIPRRINQICDLSLLNGMFRQALVIDPPIIKESIHGMDA